MRQRQLVKRARDLLFAALDWPQALPVYEEESFTKDVEEHGQVSPGDDLQKLRALGILATGRDGVERLTYPVGRSPHRQQRNGKLTLER